MKKKDKRKRISGLISLAGWQQFHWRSTYGRDENRKGKVRLKKKIFSLPTLLHILPFYFRLQIRLNAKEKSTLARLLEKKLERIFIQSTFLQAPFSRQRSAFYLNEYLIVIVHVQSILYENVGASQFEILSRDTVWLTPYNLEQKKRRITKCSIKHLRIYYN